jgi:hypothetical protein
MSLEGSTPGHFEFVQFRILRHYATDVKITRERHVPSTLLNYSWAISLNVRGPGHIEFSVVYVTYLCCQGDLS